MEHPRNSGKHKHEVTVEEVVRYKLDRGCVDEFALRSQQLSKAAWDEGVFDERGVGDDGSREVICVGIRATRPPHTRLKLCLKPGA